MWFSRKEPRPAPGSGGGPGASTQVVGAAAEDAALAHLQRCGLTLLQRNFRTPGRGGGEVDLIMREPDGTLVFVEVRQRSSTRQGGAGASITATKQRRIVWGARHFLLQFGSQPPCRFDVVLLQGPLTAGTDTASAAQNAVHIEWLRAAFDAGVAA